MVSDLFLTTESKLPPSEGILGTNKQVEEVFWGSLGVYPEAPSPSAYDKDSTHHDLLL